MKRTVIIPTGREKDILADITANDGVSSKGVVVFCHGYKGYKDWGAWNIIANEFANQGFTFIKINFSHNGGTMDNPIDFPDLEAFGNNTYSKEVQDLFTVIDWAVDQYRCNVSLIGHSRGGGIVTLVGPRHLNVCNVISWAGVADFKERFPIDDKLQEWKAKGVYHVVNGRTKQEMPHYFSFYEDFKQNEGLLTISNAAAAIVVPHLVIHGDNDEAVAIEDAYRLCEFNPNATLEIITEANHTFGSKHPWIESFLPEPLNEVVEKTINFIHISNKL